MKASKPADVIHTVDILAQSSQSCGLELYISMNDRVNTS
jgi:hypothetical protein